MPEFKVNVVALYGDLTISAETLEEALQIAAETIRDRWPDDIIATPVVVRREVIDYYCGC